MTKGLSPLVGMPASVAFDKLGFPTDERMIAGRKVYIWSKSQIVSSGGDVGEFKCTVRIFVDASETITSSDWSGNLGGCASYMRRLGV